jgi:PTH2 family peptidyl-tRNA hydrolase
MEGEDASCVRQDVKQVIVIRKDLKMRRGKEIAQGAHAAMEWIARRVTGEEREFSEAEVAWLEGGMRKIVCVVESEEALLEVARVARAAGLTQQVIVDAGLTEFGGVPTVTACAVGPDWDATVDAVTGRLRLY